MMSRKGLSRVGERGGGLSKGISYFIASFLFVFHMFSQLQVNKAMVKMKKENKDQHAIVIKTLRAKDGVRTVQQLVQAMTFLENSAAT